MKLKIPRSIFILVWCIAGLIILGYYLIFDLVNNNEIDWSLKMMGQTFWFLVFLWYTVFYFKSTKKI